jgi:hypothetical protein
MTEIETTSEFVGPVPVVRVTVMFELPETIPVNPLILAVICTVPAPPDAVTKPVELTVATSAEEVVQVARLVTFSVVEG